VIIFESAWNRPNEEQVIGRAVRYKSHNHLPVAERHVDIYHLLIVKPPMGTSGRTKLDRYESADIMLKRKIEEKDIDARMFLKRLYPLSIEQVKC